MTAVSEALCTPRPLSLWAPEAAGGGAGGREALDRQVCPARGWVERGAEGGTRVLPTPGPPPSLDPALLRLPPHRPPHLLGALTYAGPGRAAVQAVRAGGAV